MGKTNTTITDKTDPIDTDDKSIKDYLSPHVFDGTRPIPDNEARILREQARKSAEEFKKKWNANHGWRNDHDCSE